MYSRQSPTALRRVLTAGGLIALACGMETPDPTFTPTIGGMVVQCTSFDGARVLTVFDPTLGDIGRATPRTFSSPPTITLNSALLERLPDSAQLFWYGHECGHHVLGHLVSPSTLNESNADCWSVQTLKIQGLIDRQGVIETASFMLNNPGTPWGHLPGLARADLLVGCYDSAGLPDYDEAETVIEMGVPSETSE